MEKSIYNRLKNVAKLRKRPVQEVLKYYAEAEYHGISAAFSAQLFTAKLPMRIDFGFSDTILPHPAKVKYPILLGLPCPRTQGIHTSNINCRKI